MRFEGVELLRVEIPFRDDIGTAAGVHHTRPLLFVRVVSDGAEGWGECAALANGTSVDPSLQAVEQAAVDRAIPRLATASQCRSGRLVAGAEVARLFGSSPVDRVLAATFEMAVTDLELRAGGALALPGARDRARVRVDARRGGGRDSPTS